MRRIGTVLALTAAIILGGAGAAQAVTPPDEFGGSWDNPRTAAPPVAKPPTRSCTEQIVDHGFADFNNFISAYTPPADCTGPWAKVVLHLDGAVKGRQFDRLGWLTIGGVMVLKTSTPEPSPAGITWSVEKDISRYAAVLRAPQTVSMFLGNVVNDTYTGVLFIKVSLTFYTADRGHPAPPGASDVLPLTASAQNGLPDLTGTVTVARNTERLLAEVYASGSGGGCEEFWYATAPSSTGYSCPADPGPYREVQVLLDGQLAGIAEPFPHVYTGGWSPYLWYVLPAPRAFDLQPVTYDLSPYLAQLTDGAAHQVSVHVVGVPAGQAGWDTPVNFLGWRDPGSAQVTGKLLTHRVGTLTDQSTVRVSGTDHTVTTHATHELSATGLLHTSHGPVITVVHQRVGNDSVHHWGDGENPDGVTGTWTDESSSLVVGRSPHAGLTRADRRYHLDGNAFLDAAGRYAVTMTVTDAATTTTRGSVVRLDDTYTGQASFLLNAPRDQRHATGTSAEHYRLTHYDHLIRTRNGFVTDDRLL
jgi:hypothetical protein